MLLNNTRALCLESLTLVQKDLNYINWKHIILLLAVFKETGRGV